MYNEYVINVRKAFQDWEPIDTAPTEADAIKIAKTYLPLYEQVEVVYSSTDGLIDHIVWRGGYNDIEVKDNMFWDDMETGILDDDEEDF